MKQAATTEQELTKKYEDDEVSLIDLMIILAKHKKLIFSLPICGAVLSAALSLAMPNIYQANTTLLPPQQSQSSAAALLSQLGGVAGAAAGVSGIKNPGDLYIGMLKSRTIADRIVTRFDLSKVYDVQSKEVARKKLATSTEISSGKDGLISIQVEDQDQERVAKIANAYGDELIALTKVLAVTEASQRRVFFEGQLEQSKNNLAKAEMALKGALDTHGVSSAENESATVLRVAARLNAEISAKEIQLNSMRPFVTVNHPEFKRLAEELVSSRAELSNLENGKKAGGGAVKTPGDHPSGLENIQRVRDLKYNQMLYELLARQYEAARLDEAKSPSIIQVLDRAVSPERKSKPGRSVIVLMSVLAALVLAVVWAFISEAVQRAKLSPKVSGQYSELKSLLRLR